MRMLEGHAADAYVKQLEKRGSRFDEIEPAVRKIVEEVRDQRRCRAGCVRAEV